MLTREELTQIRENPTVEAVPALLAEIERLQKFVLDYGKGVTQKIDVIEENRVLLEAENQRLVTAKEILGIERDACVALLARLAIAGGTPAGLASQRSVVVDLPSGQVSWEIGESETHLLEGLPEYTGAVEPLEIEENYRRVMNPGIGQA